MLSEVDRCVRFMLHPPKAKRKEVLERAPRDSANFDRVAEVVFTGGGVDVREYMKESSDMALRSIRTQRNDNPRGNERHPPAPPGPRWEGGPPGWQNEPSNQGNWRSDREAGGNPARQKRLTLHVGALRCLLTILSDPDCTLPIIPVRLGTSTRVYSTLWDSGSQGDFIHPRVVKEALLPMTGSPTPIFVTLGDEKTQRFVDQTVTDLPFFLTLEPTDRPPASRRHRSSAHFDVMETGYDFILVTPWSRQFRSSEADWATNTLVLKTKCGQTYRSTQLRFSSSYYPQTNGQIEVTNRTLRDILRKIVCGDQQWDLHLAHAEIAYNHAVSPATGMSPYYCDFGYHPRVPADFLQPSQMHPDTSCPALDDWVAHMMSIMKIAHEHIAASQNRMAARANRSRMDHPFKVGDDVLIDARHLQLEADTLRKFRRRFFGPCRVSLLRPCRRPSERFAGRSYERPSPIMVDDHEEFLVSDIIGRRVTDDNPPHVEYLVRWKGYPDEATWEPLEHLQHARMLVRAYDHARRAGLTAPPQPTDPPPSPSAEETAEVEPAQCIEPSREVPGGVEVSLPTASEGWHPMVDWVAVELMENMVYLVTRVEWRADENGEWNPDPRGYVRAKGRLYVSEDGWREFGVRLASREDPLSMFEGAWQLVWQAAFEFADPGVDDVTTNLRVAMVGSFELPSENVRMRFPPFLVERLGGLKLVRQAVADLADSTYEDTLVHREYYRAFLEMGPFSGEQRYEVLRILRVVFTTRPRAPIVGSEVLWVVVRREISRGMTNEERNKGSNQESAKLEGTKEDGKGLSTGESSGKAGGSKRGPQENREGRDNERVSPRNSEGTTPKKTKVSDARRKLAEIERRAAEYKARLIEQMMVGNEEDPQGEVSRERRMTSQGEAKYGAKDNSHKETPSKKGKEKGDFPAMEAEKATTPPTIDSGASRLPATPKVTKGCDGLWSLRERVLGWFDPGGTPKIGEKQKESKEGEGTSAVGEAGSSEGGPKKMVATLTRALNKNQGYLANAKKKLTFDGENITEFLIDYENLTALLKWTEDEKMDHLGQHVSLSLGRDIMVIVTSSGSWKETRNEMMRKYLKAEKMATEAEFAVVQRKNYATYNDFLRAFTLVALRIPGVTDRIMSKYFLRQFSEFDKDKILSAYQQTTKFEYTRDVDFSTVTDLAEKTVVTETLALLKEGEVIDLTRKTGDKIKKGIESLHERVHGVDNKIERVENALLVMQAQVSRPALPPQEAVVPTAVANRGFDKRDPTNEQWRSGKWAMRPRENVVPAGQSVGDHVRPREDVVPAGQCAGDHVRPKEDVVPAGQCVGDHARPREEVVPAGQCVGDHGRPREEVVPAGQSVGDHVTPREDAVSAGQCVGDHVRPREDVVPVGQCVGDHGRPREDAVPAGQRAGGHDDWLQWPTEMCRVIPEINGGYTNGKSGWGILGKKVRATPHWSLGTALATVELCLSGPEMPIDVREGVSVVLPEEGTWTDLEPAYETVTLDEKDAFLWIETIWTKVSLTRLLPSLMDLEFRGTVEARGWVYVSQEMENAMVVGLVLEQLFKQAEREVVWAACQRAEMEMEKMEVRVELGDWKNMRRLLRTMRCVLPPFLVDAVFGTKDRLERICRSMTSLRLYQCARQDFFRLSVEAGPFEGNWAEELAEVLNLLGADEIFAPSPVHWQIVYRNVAAGETFLEGVKDLFSDEEGDFSDDEEGDEIRGLGLLKRGKGLTREWVVNYVQVGSNGPGARVVGLHTQGMGTKTGWKRCRNHKEGREGEGSSAVGEAGSSEGGLKRIVVTLTRALNKNQGYIADAKKKLTFDGANITEFLIDYENLAALLKWTEEEKMDHLEQHVSLSLGRDIMAIVSSSGSWKETRNGMMRKYLKAEKMATDAELAAVQRKNYATYNDFLRAFTLVALRIPGVTDRIMSKYFLRHFSKFNKDKIMSAYQQTSKFEYTRDVDFSTVTNLAEKTMVTDTLALLKEGEVIDLTGKTGDKVKKGIKSLHERVHGVDNKMDRMENALLVMQAQASRPTLPPQEAVVPAVVANRGFGRRDPANERCKYCTMIGHFVRTCPKLNHNIMRERCSRSLRGEIFGPQRQRINWNSPGGMRRAVILLNNLDIATVEAEPVTDIVWK
ncbi:hypothetical protein CBR_g2682 [Chara braunii]|uniref:Chromo domain-containing protein n=1 Tax=Chara braunii TaxID=69332 RepID=A0A388KDM3_CHABU|nr:hypothetical protein CBR_g2682 [Chara braunii]|eukprot:GBG68131.1 hypothetical protein CBR_g2682 [Chara braunii]